MSQNQVFYDDQGREVDPFAVDDEPQDDPAPNFRRTLENRASKAEKKAQDAETRAEKAERQLAFAQAGIPLDNPMSPYFIGGYQGELTTDAIKAEAAKLNLVKAPETDVVPSAEKDAHARMAAANAGAGTPGGRDFDAEMRAATTPQQLEAIYQAKGGQVVND
jgi:hypothetical protein